MSQSPAYWSQEPSQIAAALQTTPEGLSQSEAEQRLRRYGANSFKDHRRSSGAALFFRQLKNPLVLILIFAALISAMTGEWSDAVIVLVIVLGSTLLGFVQEYRAQGAMEKLRSKIRVLSSVLRDGQIRQIPSEQIVPGDVVLLNAGTLIPADGVVLEANDLFVSQALLTGEAFPVEKRPGAVDANASLASRVNCVYMGANVRNGTGRALIVHTGKESAFGQIAEKLQLRPPVTEFERGVERFGFLLTRIMIVMVLVVLAVNILRAKPAVDSLLFALALAVGLTPELLPAIISVMLAHGAQQMARRGVIVRRLNAIENFGSMNVLCTDKTGTLTIGSVNLANAVDPEGAPSDEVLRLAYWNASLQSGLNNALDEAIVARARQKGLEIDPKNKIDEIPYDFSRKRLSIILRGQRNDAMMIAKGAFSGILQVCSSVRLAGASSPLDDAHRQRLDEQFRKWSEEGYRVLGIATRPIDLRTTAYSRDDETSLEFAGFLLFFDPPKPDVAKTIAELRQRGVELKIITGDNQLVARHVAEMVGLPAPEILTGGAINQLGDEALWHAAKLASIFAEVDPNQKERIIEALRKTGNVVGYMGDGINDAPALHAADVSISVNTAVDVAKEASDLVLLENNLDILRDGIEEGRRTFANTQKYILTTISANFGNMFSMAAASIFLPFLPLLASQILLNNLLSDIPGAAMAGDNIDPEWVATPRRWNNRFIGRFMVLFGLVSSLFDFLTFGMLLFLFSATEDQFRTSWFVESLLTELVIALVVRTRRLFFRSRPGALLLGSTLAIIGLTLVLPYLPIRSYFRFVPLPPSMLLAVIGLTGLYIVAAEVAKGFFYSREHTGSSSPSPQKDRIAPT